MALQHTLRTGSQWVDATAPNGYSLYQFAYGVIGSVIQNFKIDKAMAALLGKAYDFDRFCRIGGGLLLASLISIAAVLLVTVVYNIVNLAYLHRVNKMEKAEVPTLEETKVQRWNRALPVIHRVYAALSYLSLLICLSSVFPLSMISGAALGAKTAGDSATASSIAARAKIAIVIGFVLFFIIAVRGSPKSGTGSKRTARWCARRTWALICTAGDRVRAVPDGAGTGALNRHFAGAPDAHRRAADPPGLKVNNKKGGASFAPPKLFIPAKP